MKKNDTYAKTAKKQICSVTLADFESKHKKFEFITDKELVPQSAYIDLVLFCPTSQSNLGIKISNKLQKHIDELVDDLITGLDLKHVYFFSSFESKKKKESLTEKIKADSNPYLMLYCSSCVTESIYASIRNALAHGNIAKLGKYYYLYSVSSKDANEKIERNKKLSFILKIYDLSKIEAYITAFNKYN